MPNVVSRKYLVAGNTFISVDVFDDSTVNVAATGTISIGDFARLAASVLSEHNTKCGQPWWSFPNCNDLVDR